MVLLDGRMRTYLASVPDGERFSSWLSAHHAMLLGRIDDRTYGLMEIYRVSR